MTGFFGILQLGSSPANPDAARRLMARIAYLGLDHHQVWHDESTTLGVSLTRVTDDTRDEIQPLTLGGVTVVTNAYLVNRPDLISQLRASGTPTPDDLPHAPDAELILYAYQAWSDAFPQHLLGSFALAVWDANHKRLVLASDHIGQSALYYAITPGALVFSNDLGAVRSHPDVNATVDEWAVACSLLMHNLHWNDETRTPFAGIRQLLPAHVWTIDRDAQRTPQNAPQLSTSGQRRYWSLPLDDPMIVHPRLVDYVEHFRELLTTIVQQSIRTRRLVIALSGGLDSPTLAAVARQVQQNGQDIQLSALNEGFHYLHYTREPYFAWLVARKLDIPIQFMVGDSYPVADPLPATMEMDAHFQRGLHEDWTHMVRQAGSVVFFGDGPDELFLVTPLLHILRRSPADALRLYRQLWKTRGRRPLLRLRAVLEGARDARRPPPAADQSLDGFPAWIDPDFEKRLGLKELWRARWEPPGAAQGDLHPFQPFAYRSVMTARWTPATELVAPEITPVRRYSPFLDVRMIRFAMALQPQLSLRPKFLLRRAMQGILPDEVLERPKEPLGRLLESLLRQPGAEWVDHWQPHPAIQPYVRREAVPRIVGWDVDYAQQFVNVRPLVLNNWLSAIERQFAPPLP